MRIKPEDSDELSPNYDFDYSKSKPNRFVEAYEKGELIFIDGREGRSESVEKDLESE